MRTLYKLGQTVETDEEFGRIKEIRLKETGTEYVLEDDEIVPEADVTAVYRRVAPRKAKVAKLARKRSTKSDAQAAA